MKHISTIDAGILIGSALLVPTGARAEIAGPATVKDLFAAVGKARATR